MKKKIKYILIGIILINIFLVCNIQKEKDLNKIKNNENIELAIYINEEETNIIPSKDSGYYYDREKSSCTNGAYINWDSISWSPVVQNMNEYKTRCELHFTTTYTEGILNGTDPVLEDPLIPVTIEADGTVKRADLESEWYSYANKEWANAVILEDFDLYDLSGNNYNGKLINGAEIVTDSEGNKAISFDGIDDYVDIVDLPATIDWESGFTIEFEATWRQFKRYSRIMDFSTVENDYVLYVNNTSTKNTMTLGGRIGNPSDGSINQEVNSQLVLNEKEKHTFKYIKNGTEYKLEYYKNDNLVESFDKGDKYYKNVSYTDVYLGRSAWAEANGDEYFDGLIYNIKITDASGKTILWYDLNNENSLQQSQYETNEIIPENAIESYFVWIPKYRYQLWDLGNYDSLTSIDENKVHEIPIIFGDYNTSDDVSGECITPMTSGATGNCAVGDYMTHPAFLSIPSTGFWVGKFETGYNGASSTTEAEQNINDSSKVIIKPNVYSWRGIQVANAFYSSYNYQRNLDSHMMKNTEWGAVAYLSHSIYGINQKIRINNNSDYVTGYAAINEPSCKTNLDNEECNQFGTASDVTLPYNTEVGYLANTTGNITGIYDMSGGSIEYLMGVMLDENNMVISGRDENENSGFNGVLENECDDASIDCKSELTTGYDLPALKYYDTYLYGINHFDYYHRILGDVTGELGPFSINEINNDRLMSSWYTNEAHFINKTGSWFANGNSMRDGNTAGIFTFGSWNGKNQINGSFRLILTPTGGST